MFGAGRRIWPCRGRIAQLVEQLTLNQRAVGSSPTAPTKHSRGYGRPAKFPGNVSAPCRDAVRGVGVGQLAGTDVAPTARRQHGPDRMGRRSGRGRARQLRNRPPRHPACPAPVIRPAQPGRVQGPRVSDGIRRADHRRLAAAPGSDNRGDATGLTFRPDVESANPRPQRRTAGRSPPGAGRRRPAPARAKSCCGTVAGSARGTPRPASKPHRRPAANAIRRATRRR